MNMVRTLPVSEIFGPTIQGEGPLVGSRTMFLRTAYCDFDCGAGGGKFVCDTQYAIHPSKPGWKMKRMTVNDIMERLFELGATKGDLLAISGGNPAMYLDHDTARALAGVFKLTIETQGSIPLKIDVSAHLHCVVISPKPPSSNMHTRMKVDTVVQLLSERYGAPGITCLKYVAFDDADLEWISDFDSDVRTRYIDVNADEVDHEYERIVKFLSVGSPVDPTMPLAEFRRVLLDDTAKLYNTIATDPRFHSFRGSPQMHALAWGPKGEADGAYKEKHDE